jgi:hypothetical protein
LPLVAAGANWRSRLFGLPFGDQAPFATREAYDAVGGHPPWPFLDDFELALRLRRLCRPLLLSAPVHTSCRRYLERGRARSVLGNLSILTRFALGDSPTALAQRYRSTPRSTNAEILLAQAADAATGHQGSLLP